MDNAHIRILGAVMESAESGARSITSITDLIQDARNEVGLCYELRRAKGDPPLDFKGWAFICGKNYVIRNINIGRRDIELSSAIADSLTDSTEEARLIQLIDQPSIRLDATDAIAAIRNLITITISIIETKGDPIDLSILELHYHEHKTFSKIAEELDLSEDCVRKRWSRLLLAVSVEVMNAVKADSKLAKVFSAILDSPQDFRISLLGLLSLVSAKGLPAIEAAIETMMP
jgi:RNA polymerase sigma factor (sigma-70 family)